MSFIKLIEEENEKSIQKWGDQKRSLPEWMAILMEEVGELSKEAVEITLADEYPEKMAPNPANFEKELIQVASVCLSIHRDFKRKSLY